MQPDMPNPQPEIQTNPMPPTQPPMQPQPVPGPAEMPQQPMQPPVQQQPIQMPQPMQGAPGQALFSGKCWYMPQGKRSIFSGKEAVVTVYLGVAIITNALTHDEVQRWQMQGSKTDRVGGYVRMQELEGQKKSIFASGNVLYFYNPLFSMLSAFTMFFGGKNAKACQAAMKQAGAQ